MTHSTARMDASFAIYDCIQMKDGKRFGETAQTAKADFTSYQEKSGGFARG